MIICAKYLMTGDGETVLEGQAVLTGGNYGQAGETVETRGQRDLFREAFAAGRGEGLRRGNSPSGIM